MPYATELQFIEKFGRDESIMLTNLDDSQADEVDSVTLIRALNDATALIDSYLAGRYNLPFASIPQVLVPRCLDITRYYLDRNAAREDVRQRYEDAIRWLELVAKGTIKLGLDALNAVPAAQPNYPAFEAGERTFTNNSLKDFVG